MAQAPALASAPIAEEVPAGAALPLGPAEAPVSGTLVNAIQTANAAAVPAPAPSEQVSDNETTVFTNGTCNGRGDYNGDGLFRGSGVFIVSGTEGATISGAHIPTTKRGAGHYAVARLIGSVRRISF